MQDFLKVTCDFFKIFNFRFFSRLVGEGLLDFQREVAQVMESIGFSFNNLYFVIQPFKLFGVNGVIAVIEDAVAMTLKHRGKGVHRLVV